MVDQFNKRVEYQGIPPEEMQAVCVELKDEPGKLDDERFDVIVVSCPSNTNFHPTYTTFDSFFTRPSALLHITISSKV